MFAYARPGATAVGGSGQVIVLANMGAEKFGTYDVPSWPWGGAVLTEIGDPGAGVPTFNSANGTLTVSIDAFQVRVFTV